MFDLMPSYTPAWMFHSGILCTIFGVYWSNYITQTEVLKISKAKSIKDVKFHQTELRWAGPHMSRIENLFLKYT